MKLVKVSPIVLDQAHGTLYINSTGSKSETEILFFFKFQLKEYAPAIHPEPHRIFICLSFCKIKLVDYTHD